MSRDVQRGSTCGGGVYTGGKDHDVRGVILEVWGRHQRDQSRPGGRNKETKGGSRCKRVGSRYKGWGLDTRGEIYTQGVRSRHKGWDLDPRGWSLDTTGWGLDKREQGLDTRGWGLDTTGWGLDTREWGLEVGKGMRKHQAMWKQWEMVFRCEAVQ